MIIGASLAEDLASFDAYQPAYGFPRYVHFLNDRPEPLPEADGLSASVCFIRPKNTLRSAVSKLSKLAKPSARLTPIIITPITIAQLIKKQHYDPFKTLIKIHE